MFWFIRGNDLCVHSPIPAFGYWMVLRGLQFNYIERWGWVDDAHKDAVVEPLQREHQNKVIFGKDYG